MDAPEILFIIEFFHCCAHHQVVKIVLNSIWYLHTLQVVDRCPVLSQSAHWTATYRV